MKRGISHLLLTKRSPHSMKARPISPRTISSAVRLPRCSSLLVDVLNIQKAAV